MKYVADNSGELYHARTPGSKNGNRLYQFINGRYTEEGKRRKREAYELRREARQRIYNDREEYDDKGRLLVKQGLHNVNVNRLHRGAFESVTEVPLKTMYTEFTRNISNYAAADLVSSVRAKLDKKYAESGKFNKVTKETVKDHLANATTVAVAAALNNTLTGLFKSVGDFIDAETFGLRRATQDYMDTLVWDRKYKNPGIEDKKN